MQWHQYDNHYTGGLDHKITVDCGGWTVKMTMPRAIMPTQYNRDEWLAFRKSLPGKRIRFNATLALGRDGDPSSVNGLRPTKAQLV